MPLYTGRAHPLRVIWSCGPTSTVELSPVEQHRHRRVTAVEHVRDGGAGGAGSARRGLADAALEDPGTDRAGRQRPRTRTRSCDWGTARGARSPGRSRAGRARRARRSDATGSRTAGCRRSMCRKCHRRPAAVSSPTPSAGPDGKSALVSRGRCPSRPSHVVGGVDPSPGSRRPRSESRRSSSGVQPLRRRYMTASRAPLPERSDSEPSGLKIRSCATHPGSFGRREQQDPVGADAEVWRADQRGPAQAVSSNSSCCASRMM